MYSNAYNPIGKSDIRKNIIATMLSQHKANGPKLTINRARFGLSEFNRCKIKPFTEPLRM